MNSKPPQLNDILQHAAPYIYFIFLAIDTVDIDGNVTQIPNPEIVKDEQERKDTQSVIDTATQEVKDLAKQRVSAR